MGSTRRMALVGCLALAGLLISLAEVNAWFRNRCARSSSCNTLVVRGTVYELDGTALTAAPVRVTVTDSTRGRIIGTATSSTFDGSYSVAFTGAPLADNILFIVFQRNNGVMTTSFTLSANGSIDNLAPVVPK